MKTKREEIAEKANIIVSGIAFIKKEEYIYAINLHNTHYSTKFSLDKKIISSNMSDKSLSNVTRLLNKNMQFIH